VEPFAVEIKNKTGKHEPGIPARFRQEEIDSQDHREKQKYENRFSEKHARARKLTGSIFTD
jgi:hypothetical protein